MSKFVVLIISTVVFLSLTSCKTWYKPGADEEALTADQQRCEDETGASTGNIFLGCMRRAGWHHSNGSVAATESEAVMPSVVEAETAQSEARRDNALPDEAEVIPAETVHAPGRRHVGGWIQFGENAGQLEDARAQCDKAGTGGKTFNECMQVKGWRPITFRLSVEEPGELD